MSKDGYLPPGVSYNDIDPPNPCEGCEFQDEEPTEDRCPGYDKCPRVLGEPRDVDDRGDDE